MEGSNVKIMEKSVIKIMEGSNVNIMGGNIIKIIEENLCIWLYVPKKTLQSWSKNKYDYGL